jgi:hypothetical protein
MLEIGKSGIQSVLYRSKEFTGIDKINDHRYRQTFAIEYLRNGGDIYTLQYYWGIQG